MKFQIVDAFATEMFGGNPAGVVIIQDGEDFPKEEIMIKTAAELRYSETAFVKQTGNDEFHVRYFTPASEVDLCGHATIGSAYSLMKLGIVKSNTTITYNTMAGKIKVYISDDEILMDMADPRLLEEIQDEKKIQELYEIMGIKSEKQGIYDVDKDIYLIPRKVSTGLIDIMLPVRDEEQLEKINPDFQALAEISEKYGVVGVHAFAINTNDDYIHTRNFAPLYDIDEEAATGTSNAALTYYLYNLGIVKENETNIFIQGEKMNRPSRIYSKAVFEKDEIQIKIGGFAVTIVDGNIKL